MGHHMTEFDIIIHILNNLAKEYKSVDESLESDIDNEAIVTIEKCEQNFERSTQESTRVKSSEAQKGTK
jgi:hypothetical protein